LGRLEQVSSFAAQETPEETRSIEATKRGKRVLRMEKSTLQDDDKMGQLSEAVMSLISNLSI
jgi:hypothetical protein